MTKQHNSLKKVSLKSFFFKDLLLQKMFQILTRICYHSKKDTTALSSDINPGHLTSIHLGKAGIFVGRRLTASHMQLISCQLITKSETHLYFSNSKNKNQNNFKIDSTYGTYCRLFIFLMFRDARREMDWLTLCSMVVVTSRLIIKKLSRRTLGVCGQSSH